MDARRALRNWYRPRREAYPWRTDPPDPYRVLISEVMLQQTQAARVAGPFVAFVRRFPTVRSLAGASRADVLRAWAGLGYNRRAVALHEAARVIVRDHGGVVPGDVPRLRSLPGIGPYTAAAVASIGHGVPVAAVDTNVQRVASRFLFGRNPHQIAPPTLRQAIDGWLDRGDPGSWNQAVMDLGRVLCRPLPRCDACPLASSCRFSAPAHRDARPASRPQAPFEGSTRQLRGAIVRELRGRRSVTLSQLANVTGRPIHRVAAAARSLHGEGLAHAGRAALAGRGSGRVRLPG